MRQIPRVKVTKVQHVSFLLYPSLPLHFPCEHAVLMQWPPYRVHMARMSCLSIWWHVGGFPDRVTWNGGGAVDEEKILPT
jgi:hypothetical protein